MTMDILTMNNGGFTGMTDNPSNGINKETDTTALRRLSEIAHVFTSTQAAHHHHQQQHHQRSNSNITDMLRSNKRSSLSLSNGFSMTGLGNGAASASAPSSAIRASDVLVTSSANPTKRQKLDQASTSSSNPMARMLLLQQQQRQLQQRIQLDHQQQQRQQQPNISSDDNSGGSDEAASNDGLSVEDDAAAPQPKEELDGGVRFREYQAESWSDKFEELCIFRRQQGHCHVPHNYTENQGLAQWVKRQRYQYKLKLDGKRSTLSDERVRLLNKIGFIWNSHDAVWEERLQDLVLFKQIHGHCMVPSNFEPNIQLAIWIKRQRRQYKKYIANQASSMTLERIARLEAIGFVWDCRMQNKQQQAQRETSGDVVTASNAPNVAAMMAEQQHQRQQLILMKMQLVNKQQAEVRAQAELDQGEGKNDNVAASALKENAALPEHEGKQDGPSDETSAVTHSPNLAAVQPTPHELEQKPPVRMPRCEFFSFSRQFKEY